MSTLILSACWPLDLSPSQKLVVISLADQANDEGVCWPSMASLMRRTCLSERAVRNALRDLEAGGYLRTHHREGRSSYYTVTPAAGAPRQEMPDTPAPRAAHPGTTCRTPRQQVPPEPSLNHQGTITEPIAAPVGAGYRGTRLSPSWGPDEESIQFAVDRGFSYDALREEVNRFKDYWTAQPGQKGLKLDWKATFRNWIRNANRNAGARHGTHHPGSSRTSLVERVRANAERIAAAEAAAHGDDDGHAVAAHDGAVRAPLDGTARRVS